MKLKILLQTIFKTEAKMKSKILLNMTCFLICSMLFSACTTTYLPVHRLVERHYTPKKKGAAMVVIFPMVVARPSEGPQTKQEAYKKGLEIAKKSMKEFCEGPFTISNISTQQANIPVSLPHTGKNITVENNVTSTKTYPRIGLETEYELVHFECKGKPKK